MKKQNKILIIVITSLLLIFLIQEKLFNSDNIFNQPIEHFDGVDLTNITSFEPRQGDSSTIITIKGTGLDFIGEILFNDMECVIFEDRTDEEIKILPPSLNELGKTIEEVRTIMNEGTDIGLSTKEIKIVRRNKDGKIPNISKQDGIAPSDAYVLNGIIFYYIDKINYVDNCPKLPEPKAEPEEPEEIIDNSEVPGSDLAFLKEELPSKIKRLQELIDKQNKTIKYYESLNIDNNNIEYLTTIQALETLNNMKKEYNIQRYNLHKTISKRYGY
uniref:IPT/TIG domain-containing protein n=1 Tax=Mimiviridae sp. ChoanoV1 TaxID=2596887 RepID=A0A5B8IE74_9VIRU|nr:hypothetical protein 5_23 [Mimiviridae sp. ChoanoV1]